MRINMKTTTLYGPVRAFLVITFLLSGCGDRSGQTKTETTSESAVASQTSSVCYRQVVGRDTTSVRLVIDGSSVTGELVVLPAEKDRAQGSISGTRTGNQIVADWQRSGEGSTQVHEVNFSMAGDSLLWREGERVEKQGKWVLANPDQGFQYKLAKVDCPE